MKLYFYLTFLSVIFGSSQALHETLRRAMAEEGSGGLNEKGFSYRQTVIKFPNEDVTVVSNKTSVNGASTIYNTKADEEGRLTTNAEKLTAGVETSNGHVEQNGAVSAISKTSAVNVKHQDLNTERRNKINFGMQGSVSVQGESTKQVSHTSHDSSVDAQLLQRAQLLQERGPSRRVAAAGYRPPANSNPIPAIQAKILKGVALEQPQQPEQPEQPEQLEQPQEPEQLEQLEQPEQPEQEQQPVQPAAAIGEQILQGISLSQKSSTTAQSRLQINPTGRRLSPYRQPLPAERNEIALENDLFQASGRQSRQLNRNVSRNRQENVMEIIQDIWGRPKRNQNQQCSCLSVEQKNRIHRSAIALLRNLSQFFERQVSGFVRHVLSMPSCL